MYVNNMASSAHNSRLANIVARYTAGIFPTRNEINFMLRSHFNQKIRIDAMPRGPARNSRLRNWNRVGRFIDTYLVNVQYNKI